MWCEERDNWGGRTSWPYQVGFRCLANFATGEMMQRSTTIRLNCSEAQVARRPLANDTCTTLASDYLSPWSRCKLVHSASFSRALFSLSTHGPAWRMQSLQWSFCCTASRHGCSEGGSPTCPTGSMPSLPRSSRSTWHFAALLLALARPSVMVESHTITTLTRRSMYESCLTSTTGTG